MHAHCGGITEQVASRHKLLLKVTLVAHAMVSLWQVTGTHFTHVVTQHPQSLDRATMKQWVTAAPLTRTSCHTAVELPKACHNIETAP
jgi:Tfp pilus assembly protein PilV